MSQIKLQDFHQILKDQEFGKKYGNGIIAMYVIASIILVVYSAFLFTNLDFNIKQYKRCIQKPSATDVTFTCAGQGQQGENESRPYYVDGTGKAVLVTDFYGVFDDAPPENL